MQLYPAQLVNIDDVGIMGTGEGEKGFAPSLSREYDVWSESYQIANYYYSYNYPTDGKDS